MESGEGVTMTQSIAVPVSNVGNLEKGASIKKVQVMPEQTVTESGEIDNREVADNLLENAKNEGADAALERFVHDEEDWDLEDGEEEPQEALDPREDIDNKELPLDEKDPVSDKLNQLEEKASQVIKENSELRESLEDAQKNMKLALESIWSMAYAIREMVENEDDELKKKGILEILFEIMSNLMQAMVVPQEDDGIMQGVDPEKQKEEKIVAELFRRVEKPAA